MVVGLVGSTRSMGKPCTGGSDQQWCTGFSTCFSGTRRPGEIKAIGKLKQITRAALYR